MDHIEGSTHTDSNPSGFLSPLFPEVQRGLRFKVANKKNGNKKRKQKKNEDPDI